MYMHQGEWENAEELLQRLCGRGNENAELCCFAGQLRLARGMIEDAGRDFERALALEEGNLYAVKGRLHCLMKLNQFAEARDLVARAADAFRFD
jgi:predicted Zn-dependent protease